MRADGLDPHVLTTAQKGLVRLFGELVRYDWSLYRLARRLRRMRCSARTLRWLNRGVTGSPPW